MKFEFCYKGLFMEINLLLYCETFEIVIKLNYIYYKVRIIIIYSYKYIDTMRKWITVKQILTEIT